MKHLVGPIPIHSIVVPSERVSILRGHVDAVAQLRAMDNDWELVGHGRDAEWCGVMSKNTHLAEANANTNTHANTRI